MSGIVGPCDCPLGSLHAEWCINYYPPQEDDEESWERHGSEAQSEAELGLRG